MIKDWSKNKCSLGEYKISEQIWKQRLDAYHSSLLTFFETHIKHI